MKQKGHPQNLSRKAEDYLEAILHISLEKGYAKTKDVARRLGVSSPSVVEMFQKLDHLGMVEYRRYEGVVLTPAGRKVAEVIRFRHETLKQLLILIDIPHDIADGDACRMEHELSEKSVQKIRLFLDFLDSHSHYLHIKTDFVQYCRVKRPERAPA